MKKRWFLIGVLLLSLVALLYSAVGERTATANEGGGLYCSNINGCSGDAGCVSGGTVNNCSITCADGGAVFCRN